MRNTKIVYGSMAVGLFFALFSVHSGASAAIIRVHPSGDDSNSGLSWDPQTDRAGRDQCRQPRRRNRVAAGTYAEHIKNKTAGPSGSEVAVDTALYGGFAGTETTRDQRNWQTNLTS